MLYRVIGTRDREKRDFLLNLAKEAMAQKKRVFVLVPEQATALYERELASLCGAGSALDFEVTNFSRLSNVVLRHWGELATRSITEEEKTLLLAQIFRDHASLFSHLSPGSSPEEICALFRESEELYCAGVGEEEMRMFRERELISPSLREKLEELCLVRTLLQEKMKGRFSDPAREEEHLASVLERFPFFQNSVVLVDLFWDFTAPRLVLLRRILAQAEIVAISFLMDKEIPSLFPRPQKAARRLLSLAREGGIEVRDRIFSEEDDGSPLFYLRKHLTSPAAGFAGEPTGIETVSCADVGKEALMVCRKILEKVKLGARWQDFAVLSRDGSEEEILRLTMDEAGIPYFCQQKKPLATSPAAETVLLALRMACGIGGQEALKAYLSKGVYTCPEESRFLLEKYVSTWSLYPSRLMSDQDLVQNPDGFSPMTEENRQQLKQINQAKQTVFLPLRHLASALATGNGADKVQALVSFLMQIGTEKELMERMERARAAQKWEEAGSLVRMWNTVLERLSAIGRALGNDGMTPEEFYRAATLALSGSLPGSLPSGQDRVQIGTVDFVRPHHAKHVFVMGMCSGIFPAPAPKGRFLTDEERRSLADLGYPLSHEESGQEEEFFLFYLCTVFAKESLILSTRKGTAGNENSPSVLFKRVQALFPRLKTEHFPEKPLLPLFKEEAFSYLLDRAETGNLPDSPLQEFFLRDEDYRPRLIQCLAGLSFQKKEAALETELPYHHTDVAMSYTRLEKYSECRFAWWARYLLEAKEERMADFHSNVTGSFVHRVLEWVLCSLRDRGTSLPELTEEELEQCNREACETALKEISNESPDGEQRIFLRQLAKSTLFLLKNLREEFSVSQFEPVFFEKSLSELGGYRIPLGDGTDLCLYGNIDRVDRYRDSDGNDWVRVVDYKTGGHDFSLNDVANGLDLQMLLYLFCLWDKPLEEGAPPAKPAGILYLNGMEHAAVCENEEDLKKAEASPWRSLSRQGLLVEEDFLLFAADPEGMGAFLPVAPKKKGRSGKKALISLENLGRLRRKAEGDFRRMAQNIKKGIIHRNPLCSPGIHDSCRYCPYLPLCRRKEEDVRPYRKNVSEEEIFGMEESK